MMLVETKARIGVFAIALGAYLPQFPSLVPEFAGQYEEFKKRIPDSVELIDGGIITTKEQSMEAGDKFRAADVDLVILQLLTYATSYNMLPAVRDLDVPVVLVNLQKKKAPDYENTDTATWLGELYACGAVGEMVADLERAGKRHAVITGVVEGGDPAVDAEIADWCRAAQVRRRFRDTNLAQIGRPYPGMMDLYIDETNLYHRMWLYTKQFDWEKMWAIADDITDEEAIRAKAQEIIDTFDIEGGGTVEKGLSNRYTIHDKSSDIHFKGEFDGLQFSAGLGMGVELKLVGGLGIYVDPSLRYYFDCSQPTSIRTEEPLMMTMDIGFRFNFK